MMHFPPLSVNFSGAHASNYLCMVCLKTWDTPAISWTCLTSCFQKTPSTLVINSWDSSFSPPSKALRQWHLFVLVRYQLLAPDGRLGQWYSHAAPGRAGTFPPNKNIYIYIFQATCVKCNSKDSSSGKSKIHVVFPTMKSQSNNLGFLYLETKTKGCWNEFWVKGSVPGDVPTFNFPVIHLWCTIIPQNYRWNKNPWLQFFPVLTTFEGNSFSLKKSFSRRFDVGIWGSCCSLPLAGCSWKCGPFSPTKKLQLDRQTWTFLWYRNMLIRTKSINDGLPDPKHLICFFKCSIIFHNPNMKPWFSSKKTPAIERYMHGYAPEGYIAKEQAKGAVLGSDSKWNDILLVEFEAHRFFEFIFPKFYWDFPPSLSKEPWIMESKLSKHPHLLWSLWHFWHTKISAKKGVQNISHVVLDRHWSRECPACGSHWGYTKHDQLVLAFDNVCNTSMWPPSLYLNELVYKLLAPTSKSWKKHKT